MNLSDIRQQPSGSAASKTTGLKPDGKDDQKVLWVDVFTELALYNWYISIVDMHISWLFYEVEDVFQMHVCVSYKDCSRSIWLFANVSEAV